MTGGKTRTIKPSTQRPTPPSCPLRKPDLHGVRLMTRSARRKLCDTRRTMHGTRFMIRGSMFKAQGRLLRFFDSSATFFLPMVDFVIFSGREEQDYRDAVMRFPDGSNHACPWFRATLPPYTHLASARSNRQRLLCSSKRDVFIRFAFPVCRG